MHTHCAVRDENHNLEEELTVSVSMSLCPTQELGLPTNLVNDTNMLMLRITEFYGCMFGRQIPYRNFHSLLGKAYHGL